MGNRCPKCKFDNPPNTLYCGKCGTPLPSPKDISVSHTKTLETPKEELTTGSTFAGRYQIIEELGKGGMGKVYKAHDTEIKEKVALKLLKSEIAADEKTIERFRNEIRLARKIVHKNVGRVYDLGKAEGSYFITMEYVPGQDLRGLIRQTGQLTVGKATSIASQVCEGLMEAHRLGVVHRDLKPSNIMIDKDGNARIMDFGIARSLRAKGITGSGVMIGTPEYMSPEQVDGKPADPRADIYALGVILFEMVTGRPPFEGETAFAVANKHKSEPAPDPRELNPQLPAELSRLILRCLEKERERRFQSTPEFLADLQAVEALLPTTERVPSRTPSRTRPATSKTITVKITLRKLVIPAAALAAVAAALIILNVLNVIPRTGKKEILDKSIAVLPFINDSPDKENEYFINGTMEAILDNLCKIEDLRVIARTSVEQYRENPKPIPVIADEMNVNFILEGSGQKYGNKVRLTFQLLDARNDKHLWSSPYSREIVIEEIFTLQSEIAQLVATEIKAIITPEEKQLIEKIPTTNMTAYDAYLKGQFYVRKFNLNDLDTAMQYFELAKDKDPEFALAYAGIGYVWLVRQQVGFASPDEAAPKIMVAIERALELDSTIAEVHYMLAAMNAYGMWDWKSAESAYRKAIAINPNHAEAHALYSHLLNIVGRPKEAMEHIELALKLDPNNPIIKVLYSQDLLYVHRYDDAISVSRELFEMNPTMFMALDPLFNALHLTGRYEEAFEVMKLYFCNMYKDFDHVFDQYAKLGYAGALNLEGDTLLAQSKSKYILQFDIAYFFVFAGNKERALECLEQAYEMHDPNMPYIGWPTYASLRNEPRFQDLLRRMNLPADEKE